MKIIELFLGFIVNNTKVFKWLSAIALVAGLVLGAKHTFYVWHVEPMKKMKKELKTANSDLNTSRAELTLCESAKKNEVFEATNTANAQSVEQIIKEAKHETVNESNISLDDLFRMF